MGVSFLLQNKNKSQFISYDAVKSQNKKLKIVAIFCSVLAVLGIGTGVIGSITSDTGSTTAIVESITSTESSTLNKEQESILSSRESRMEELDSELEAEGVIITSKASTSKVKTSAKSLSAYIPKDGLTNFSLNKVPDYTDEATVTVHNGKPYFNTDKISAVSVEYYSPLDSLGRCGMTYACVGQDIMPTEERGEIGSVKPTGWHLVKYDCISDKYLYNRCHLIGYQLSGENANEQNLITGTRYLNVQGMLPYENEIADYVDSTNNHVAYRVTPIFTDNNLVANGVLMEAYSVEDNGKGVCFCVFAYNVQPGIHIDYVTGDSYEVATTITNTTTKKTNNAANNTTAKSSNSSEQSYVLNTNTKKFHLPNCSSVSEMAEHNKKQFTGSRDELINSGYSPCKRCNP